MRNSEILIRHIIHPMQTLPAKKYRLLLGSLITLSVVCIAGVVFFFARMYQRDMKTLTDFMASYQAYDQAVASASASVFNANGTSTSEGAEERRADAALSNLKTVSSLRISSLIKNEKEAMRAMQEIADLSDQEMSIIKAYRQAARQDANRDNLALAFRGLVKERQATFAYFQELGR